MMGNILRSSAIICGTRYCSTAPICGARASMWKNDELRIALKSNEHIYCGPSVAARVQNRRAENRI